MEMASTILLKLLSVMVWRERGLQKVSQIQRVRVARGGVCLPAADPTPKTDEGERAMLGWIYFAEEVAPGRILLLGTKR
jgi:hypothetical protein